MRQILALQSGNAPSEIDVNITGFNVLELVADGGDDIDFDHADWADAILHADLAPSSEAESVQGTNSMAEA